MFVCPFLHTIKHIVKTCPSGILKGEKNKQKHTGKFQVCLANSKDSSYSYISHKGNIEKRIKNKMMD